MTGQQQQLSGDTRELAYMVEAACARRAEAQVVANTIGRMDSQRAWQLRNTRPYLLEYLAVHAEACAIQAVLATLVASEQLVVVGNKWEYLWRVKFAEKLTAQAGKPGDCDFDRVISVDVSLTEFAALLTGLEDEAKREADEQMQRDVDAAVGGLYRDSSGTIEN